MRFAPRGSATGSRVRLQEPAALRRSGQGGGAPVQGIRGTSAPCSAPGTTRLPIGEPQGALQVNPWGDVLPPYASLLDRPPGAPLRTAWSVHQSQRPRGTFGRVRRAGTRSGSRPPVRALPSSARPGPSEGSQGVPTQLKGCVISRLCLPRDSAIEKRPPELARPWWFMNPCGSG